MAKDPLKGCPLTNRELAERLGVSVELVRMWRSGGRRISADRARDISEVTGIPLHELRPDLWERETA